MASPEIEKLLEEGKKFLKEKKFSDAINKFHEVTVKDRQNFLCWKLLGDAYLKAKYFDSAHRAYDSVIILQTDDGIGYFHKGSVFYDQK